MMRISRLHITIFLGISVCTWYTLLAMRGESVSFQDFKPFGTVVTVLGFFAILFEYVFWKIPFLQPWLFARPNLNGTWEVVIQSNFVAPNRDNQKDPILCYMGVTQTMSGLKMHLMTSSSESWLVASSITPSQDGKGYQVVGVYTNRPKLEYRNSESEIHRGSFIINTHGKPHAPDFMSGEYWTDRNSQGKMELSKKTKESYTRYDEAKSALS